VTPDARSAIPRRGEVLTIAFGTAVGMWAVGYVSRIPALAVPSRAVLVLMVICLLGGGFVAGRSTGRGWRGGVQVGLLVSLLNLMILGSLLGGQEPNRLVPSALWWIPGSFVVGAVLGAAGALAGTRLRREASPEANWTGRFALVLAAATLLLIVAGGLVTGHEAGLAVVDWPNSYGYNMFLYPLSRMTGGVYYEHAHRLVGALVGLTTLIFATHLQRTEDRRWLRRFAWLAFAMVVIQGLLGGLRVTGRFTLSTSAEETVPNLGLAVVHGTLAQVFFAMVTAMVVFTSPAWRRMPAPVLVPSAGTERFLNGALVVLLIGQIVLGAVVRHLSGALLVHIAAAVLVGGLALNAGVRAWGLYTGQPLLQRLGKALLVLVCGQVALGVAAYIVTGMTAGVQPRPWADVLITGAHQVTGALLLALVVALALWTWRLLAPQPSPHLEPSAG